MLDQARQWTPLSCWCDRYLGMNPGFGPLNHQLDSLNRGHSSSPSLPIEPASISRNPPLFFCTPCLPCLPPPQKKIGAKHQSTTKQPPIPFSANGSRQTVQQMEASVPKLQRLAHLRLSEDAWGVSDLATALQALATLRGSEGEVTGDSAQPRLVGFSVWIGCFGRSLFLLVSFGSP